MSQHGPAGYTPYKNKRLSSQSVQSVNSVVAQSPPPATRPAGLVRPSSTSAIVPTLNHVKAAVQSPQPYRPTASTSWSHSGAVAGPSSTPPPNSSAGRRPTPTQSVSALPFSNVSSDESPFGTPSRAGSQSPAVGGSTAGASQRPYQGRGSSAQSERARAPYHTTFQPQGVRRDRTEEFLSQRKSQGEGKKLEEGRLSRRLEKVSGQSHGLSCRTLTCTESSWSLCISPLPATSRQRKRRKALRCRHSLHSATRFEARVRGNCGRASPGHGARLNEVRGRHIARVTRG